MVPQFRAATRLRPLKWLSHDPSWFEALSGFMSWIWVGALTTNIYFLESSPVYSVLNYLGPEYVWAFAFLIVAMSHFFSLCVGFDRFRATACLLSAFMWTFMGVLFGLAQNFTGIAAYLMMLLGVFSLLAGLRNARTY